MAERLTRTKKYAELRNQIANDREESLETTELNNYQEKLNSVKSQFGRDAEPVFPSESIINKPVEQKPEITNEIKKVEDESMKTLDDILSSMMEEVYPTAPVEETLTAEPTPTVEKVEPVQETIDKQNQPLQETVIEPVKPQVQVTPTNDFVNNALASADDYNRKAGNVTLDELPNTIVDNIRHGEKPVENIAKDVDDDFSSTVSLEIEKVLAEIQNQNKEEKPVIIQEAELVDDIKEPVKEEVVAKPVEEVKVEAPVMPEPIKPEEPKEETFEHPVLTKTLEQPVVEIKNISETLNMQKPNEDIVDDTIPFNANKVQEETEDEEYDEEEGPSKVLNVILGILIFVLVVVLGIIVYYILVAKGIIG